jgi:hypothetical protein
MAILAAWPHFMVLVTFIVNIYTYTLYSYIIIIVMD